MMVVVYSMPISDLVNTRTNKRSHVYDIAVLKIKNHMSMIVPF
jgi:hypothetical protein